MTVKFEERRQAV